MLFLHLREFVENDLLKMQPLNTCNNNIEACNNSASLKLTAVATTTAAAPGVEQQQLLARVRVPAALNGVVALHLAEIAQYEE